jgi:hypothetical protein
MVELILIRDFAIPSWELDRYTRHRTVAFDRKFKDKRNRASSDGRLESLRRRCSGVLRDVISDTTVEYTISSASTKACSPAKRTQIFQ